jgi:hypothetical protein
MKADGADEVNGPHAVAHDKATGLTLHTAHKPTLVIMAALLKTHPPAAGVLCTLRATRKKQERRYGRRRPITTPTDRTISTNDASLAYFG